VLLGPIRTRLSPAQLSQLDAIVSNVAQDFVGACRPDVKDLNLDRTLVDVVSYVLLDAACPLAPWLCDSLFTLDAVAKVRPCAVYYLLGTTCRTTRSWT